MQSSFKTIARTIVYILVVAIVANGFVSVSQASSVNTHEQFGDPLPSKGLASTHALNKSDTHDHGHHSSGEQECHSISCNVYFPPTNLIIGLPYYDSVAFMASAELSTLSLIMSLYRPPKFVL